MLKSICQPSSKSQIYIGLRKGKNFQTLPIRVDLDHKLGNMQYHPNKGWLINGHDPTLEKEYMYQERDSF